MATGSGSLRRFASGPLHGGALALYFALLPYVIVTKWSDARHQSDGDLIRGLLLGLAAFWLVFLIQLARNVRRLRHGRRVGAGGSAWLATLIVATLPYLLAPDHAGAPAPPPAAVAGPLGTTRQPPAPALDRPAAPEPLALGAVPLALMARRRRDELRRDAGEPDDRQVDDTITLLRGFDAQHIARVLSLIGDRREGVTRVAGDAPTGPVGDATDPVVVCVVRDEPDDVMIAFAREGGQLRVPVQWSAGDVVAAAVGLHADGRLAFTRTESELLRALATRSLRRTLVVHLGPAGALDDELRACAVTLSPVLFDDRGAGAATRDRHHFSAPVTGALDDTVRVELLRAEPRVTGLVVPFTPTLRRRCVEMVAYLALHRHEPVTGDRLRTRVHTHADVDASTRTLANTASAVRRSLGVDARGPRLHPVTSSGLYVTHAVTSDVEHFFTLVARARAASLVDAAPLAERALALVHGEPLASALRGFEWFLAEGLAARLQRDAEWAALALHQYALEAEDYEQAFWALGQGRLVDPYSDALADAQRRVPRLRQFGGDGAGRAQHDAVGAGGAVEVRGSRERLADEVVQ
ncbi:MAG: hypothetical protein ACHQFZ_06960 [Acidimicrobiales bacterium]